MDCKAPSRISMAPRARRTRFSASWTSTFADVDDTLGLFLNVLEKDGGGNRHVVRAIIQKLAARSGAGARLRRESRRRLRQRPAEGSRADAGEHRRRNDPIARAVQPVARADHRCLGRFRLRPQCRQSFDRGAAQPICSRRAAAWRRLLAAGVGPAGDYFTADPARAKREIRERLVVTFLGSPVPGAYQTAFRQFLSDKNFLLTQLTDVLFDQVNRAIRDGLEFADRRRAGWRFKA